MSADELTPRLRPEYGTWIGGPHDGEPVSLIGGLTPSKIIPDGHEEGWYVLDPERQRYVWQARK